MIQAMTRFLKRRQLRATEDFLLQLEDQILSGQLSLKAHTIKAAQLRAELLALESPAYLIGNR